MIPNSGRYLKFFSHSREPIGLVWIRTYSDHRHGLVTKKFRSDLTVLENFIFVAKLVLSACYLYLRIK